MTKRQARRAAFVPLMAALAVAGCGSPPGTVPPAPGGMTVQATGLLSAEDLEATLKAESTRQLSAAVLDLAQAFTTALDGDRAGTLAHLQAARTKLQALPTAPLAAAQQAIAKGLARQVDRAIAKVSDERTNVQVLAVRLAGAVQEALDQVRQTLSGPGEVD